MGWSRKKIKTKEIILKMEWYCAQQERSPRHISTQLNKYELSQELRTTIMDKLQDEGFYSAIRFAKAYTQDKYKIQSWGPNKIKSGLFSHFIDKETIDFVIEEIDQESEEFHAKVQNLIIKKIGEFTRTGKLDDVNAKLIRYLLQKGFDIQPIQRNLQKVKEKGLIQPKI